MSRPKKQEGEKYIRHNISMDPVQLDKVASYCQKEDRAISWVIRKALDEYLGKVA